MTGILDQYLHTQGDATRRPARSIDDVFGIALARHLDDLDAVDLYQRAAADHSHLAAAGAFERIARNGQAGESTFAAFYNALNSESAGRLRVPPTVVALKIEAKAIGIVTLRGSRVVRTETRLLRYGDDEAIRSATGLVRRLQDDWPEASLIVEAYHNRDTRRAKLSDAVRRTAIEVAVPVWNVTAPELLAAFSVVPLRTREQLRTILPALCPYRDWHGRELELDALALAFFGYCHILLHVEDGKAPT